MAHNELHLDLTDLEDYEYDSDDYDDTTDSSDSSSAEERIFAKMARQKQNQMVKGHANSDVTKKSETVS